MKLRVLFLFALPLLLLSSCKDDGKHHMQRSDVPELCSQISRFEKEMFETPTAGLQAHLKGVRSQYNCALLNVYPDDSAYMADVVGMTKDPLVREIYDSVQKRYPDLEWLKDELMAAHKRLYKNDNRFKPLRAMTFVSGLFNYDYRVVADDQAILISLDQYVLPMFEKYGYFGQPKYLAHLSDSQYLAVDCLTAVARNIIPVPQHELTLLDYIIAEGKTLYIASIAFNEKPDSIILRYTPEQMKWAEENIGKVWGYIIQNGLLYETNTNSFHGFIEEGPQTNMFGTGSAPRLAGYCGYQIIRQLMKKRPFPLAELIDNTNSQRLLMLSGWKPDRGVHSN